MTLSTDELRQRLAALFLGYSNGVVLNSEHDESLEALVELQKQRGDRNVDHELDELSAAVDAVLSLVYPLEDFATVQRYNITVDCSYVTPQTYAKLSPDGEWVQFTDFATVVYENGKLWDSSEEWQAEAHRLSAELRQQNKSESS